MTAHDCLAWASLAPGLLGQWAAALAWAEGQVSGRWATQSLALARTGGKAKNDRDHYHGHDTPLPSTRHKQQSCYWFPESILPVPGCPSSLQARHMCVINNMLPYVRLCRPSCPVSWNLHVPFVLQQSASFKGQMRWFQQ